MYGPPVWQLGEKGCLLYLPVKKHNFIFPYRTRVSYICCMSQLRVMFTSIAQAM